MVHLATVPNDSAREKPVVEGMQNIDINQDEDEQTVSVYGSRFASQELPAHEMPEQEMPKEIAYRMIRDDLSLDGNPMLNLASFVTTYMASSSGRTKMLRLMKILTEWIGRRGREVDGRGPAKEFHRLRGISPDRGNAEPLRIDDCAHVQCAYPR